MSTASEFNASLACLNVPLPIESWQGEEEPPAASADEALEIQDQSPEAAKPYYAQGMGPPVRHLASTSNFDAHLTQAAGMGGWAGTAVKTVAAGVSIYQLVSVLKERDKAYEEFQDYKETGVQDSRWLRLQSKYQQLDHKLDGQSQATALACAYWILGSLPITGLVVTAIDMGVQGKSIKTGKKRLERIEEARRQVALQAMKWLEGDLTPTKAMLSKILLLRMSCLERQLLMEQRHNSQRWMILGTRGTGLVGLVTLPFLPHLGILLLGIAVVGTMGVMVPNLARFGYERRAEIPLISDQFDNYLNEKSATRDQNKKVQRLADQEAQQESILSQAADLAWEVYQGHHYFLKRLEDLENQRECWGRRGSQEHEEFFDREISLVRENMSEYLMHCRLRVQSESQLWSEAFGSSLEAQEDLEARIAELQSLLDEYEIRSLDIKHQRWEVKFGVEVQGLSIQHVREFRERLDHTLAEDAELREELGYLMGLEDLSEVTTDHVCEYLAQEVC